MIPSTSRELQCHFSITRHTQQDCLSLTDKDQSSSHRFQTSKRRYLRESSQANNCQNCCCCSFVRWSSSCYLQFDERERVALHYAWWGLITFFFFFCVPIQKLLARIIYSQDDDSPRRERDDWARKNWILSRDEKSSSWQAIKETSSLSLSSNLN